MSESSQQRIEVWVDDDLCGGCGKCTETAPEVFVHVDGVSRVKYGSQVLGSCEAVLVPAGYEPKVEQATNECPGEIIFLEFASVDASDSRF